MHYMFSQSSVRNDGRWSCKIQLGRLCGTLGFDAEDSLGLCQDKESGVLINAFWSMIFRQHFCVPLRCGSKFLH